MFNDVYDVLTIGNAIVDIIAHCDDNLLVDNGIIKGTMNLVDIERAEYINSIMESTTHSSGGSAGNTAAGIASFGGRVAFFGKVSDDSMGKIFADDIQKAGVNYDTLPLKNGPPTAKSMIFVTPDGERSMNTYLGACMEFCLQDIKPDKISSSKITYFEGYLCDSSKAMEAIGATIKICQNNKRQVAMSLSDPFCVDRHRDKFLHLMHSKSVKIVFANEAELKSLYQTNSLETGINLIRKDCSLAVITRSEKGSIVITEKETYEVNANPVNKVVDTTGAGDLYASGFLYGLTNGYDLPDCAWLGSMAASEIIQHMGSRPLVKLKNIIKT